MEWHWWHREGQGLRSQRLWEKGSTENAEHMILSRVPLLQNGTFLKMRGLIRERLGQVRVQSLS